MYHQILKFTKIVNVSSKRKNRNLSMRHYLPKFLSANGMKDRMLWLFFTWTSANLLIENTRRKTSKNAFDNDSYLNW